MIRTSGDSSSRSSSTRTSRWPWGRYRLEKKIFCLVKNIKHTWLLSAGCGAVLREVRVCEARPRAPLLCVRRVRAQDGPPLPLGQQLCRLLQLQGEYWPLIGPHTHTQCNTAFWLVQYFVLFLLYGLTYCLFVALSSLKYFLRFWTQSIGSEGDNFKLSMKTEMVYLFLFQVMESSIFCFCFSCLQCSVYLYVRC